MLAMTTAIIGVGNLGGTVARHLVGGGEAVVLAAKDEAHAEALAEQLGPLARSNSVDDAIATANVVVLAAWLDTIKELIAEHGALLEDKVVVDWARGETAEGVGEIVLNERLLST
jgi:predicted dinucleotide-binding enzyme